MLYLPSRLMPDGHTLGTERGDVFIHNTEYFCSFNRVEIGLPEFHWEFVPGEQVDIALELANPTDRIVAFSDSCTHKPRLVYTIIAQGEKDLTAQANYSDHLPVLAPGERIIFPVEITAPETPGQYQIMFSFAAKYITAGIHMRPVTMTVHSTSTENSMNK